MSVNLFLELTLKASVEPHQNNQRAEGTNACAHACAASSIRQAIRKEHICEDKHGNYAHQLFHNFGDSGGCHNLPALQVATEASKESYKEHRRSQGNNGIVSARVTDVLVFNQPACPEEKC